MDQAEELKRMTAPRPVKVIAVTSGKGGVGKTNISVNLSTALAREGRGVMLLDADLGLANVDVVLGLSPKRNLADVIDGAVGLEDILVEGPEGVLVVPASSGVQRMAELSPAEHAGLIRSFSEIRHDLDYLIVDTAAGISNTVLSFAHAAREVVVVACDEPSSITDASALIRVLNRDRGQHRFHVIANRVQSAAEGQDIFDKLSGLLEPHLELTLGYIGAIPEDDALHRSVQRQRPVVAAYPDSPSGRAYRDLARRVERWPLPAAAEGHLEFFVERVVQYGTGFEGEEK